jgi:hypothetical protein
LKFRVLQTIQDRDTGEVIQLGGIWDDRDQRTAYERDLLIAMGVVEPLQVTSHANFVRQDKEKQQ